MIRFIQWLIYGHAHKYEVYEKMDEFNVNKITGKETQTGRVYILKCVNCGKITTKEVRV